MNEISDIRSKLNYSTKVYEGQITNSSHRNVNCCERKYICAYKDKSQYFPFLKWMKCRYIVEQ